MILAGYKHSNDNTLVLTPKSSKAFSKCVFRFQPWCLCTLPLAFLCLKPVTFTCLQCNLPFSISLQHNTRCQMKFFLIFLTGGFLSQKCVNFLITLLFDLNLFDLTQANFCPWCLYFGHFHWKFFSRAGDEDTSHYRWKGM